MPLPASLLLIHGAGSGPSVFTDWHSHFPHLLTEAIDLHVHLDVDRASMADYTNAVTVAARRLPRPVSLCGWSMGGLVALKASVLTRPCSLVLLEPSPPAEIQGFHAEVTLPLGTFDPEQAYGPFPQGYPARPESSKARAERKRGISVPAISCPMLVLYGQEFPGDRGREVAHLYGSRERYFPDLDHWGLILDPRVPDVIAQYLASPDSW